MPHGWANASSFSPKRSVSFASMPFFFSQPCQKPSAVGATDSATAAIWPVPRRALRPDWRMGKQVMSVLGSPLPLP